MKKLQNIINQKDKKLRTIYFESQEYLNEKYGSDTILLFEIGSFYEIFQYEELGNAKEVAKILNLVLTRMNKKKEETIDNPTMCGIPTVSLQKHLFKLNSENKYTIVLIEQRGTKKITRTIGSVVSPGTNMNTNINQNNYLSSIYIEKNENNIFIGSLSLIDLNTGVVKVFESYGKENDKLLALDELYNIMNINNGKEYILYTENINKKEDLNEIYNKLDLNNKVGTHNKSISNKLNFQKINYQNKLFESIYNFNSMLSPIENLNMEKFINVSNSFTLLIEFIIEHNHNIIKNIKIPEIINQKDFLYLGNNAIEQLNMISKDNNNGLVDIITQGCTSLGKRFMRNRILNPITNKKILKERYENSDLFSLKNSNHIKKLLSDIYDIERLTRKIETKTINPFEFVNFQETLKGIVIIYKYLINDKILNKITIIDKKIIESIEKLIDQNNDFFDFDIMSKYSNTNIEESFIINNIKIDKLNIKENKLFKIFQDYGNKYDILFDPSYNDTELKFIKLMKTDKDGYFFELTKKRFSIIKNKIPNLIKIGNMNFEKKDTIFSTKINAIKISNHLFEEISNKLLVIKTNKIKTTINEYNLYLDNIIVNFNKNLSYLTNFLGELEFYITNSKLKFENYYNKPEILDKKEAFFEAIELRHPIIERIEENGIYVPNNLVLGNKKYTSIENKIFFQKEKDDTINGVMLYGLNASGKSSTMKSVGISLILAQSGFFVSAKSFRYSIYHSLFTRIESKDDIYKGLSSFAVEMIELKNIFNRTYGNTLVLGDEISHGTETTSGLAIVASTIINLLDENKQFLFATHLHQLNDIEEVSSLNNMISLHLDVEYNEKSDKLIYHRKLKEGNGKSVYGLEFAKYMKLPSKFLKIANEVRLKISKNLERHEIILLNDKTKYNKNIKKDVCEICGNRASEIHHIKEQKKANENGIIDFHHKDHQKNLINICEKHHKMIHQNLLKIKGFVKTTSGFELKYIFN